LARWALHNGLLGKLYGCQRINIIFFSHIPGNTNRCSPAN
jgi:hypothetical protein